MKKALHIPAYAWTLVVLVTLAGVGLTIYVIATDYDHVGEHRYVGPNACLECHETQHESWGKTRMANTFEVLKPGIKVDEKRMAGLDPEKDYSRDPECLPCHTTGFGLVGGFTSIEETPEMAGVTCEACHGPGGSYVEAVMDPDHPSFATEEGVAAGLVYPPTEAVCKKCHNDKSPYVGMEYKFDYDDFVERGTHEHFELEYDHSGKAGTAAPADPI